MVLIPILDNYTLLTKSEKTIADYIVNNPEKAFELNANELSECTGTSPATVGRFARKIGFESFVDAKLKMIRMSGSQQETGKSLFINKNDSYEACTQKLLAQITDVCNSASRGVDFKMMEEIVRKILKADTIYLAGIAASSIVAMDLNLKLIRLDRKTHYSLDPHVNLLGAMTSTNKDVLIAFSYSGTTKIVVETLKEAKRKGAYTIAITGNANSDLAQQATRTLSSPALEQKLRIGAVSSHYSQQFISDLLFLSLITNLYDVADSLIMNTSDVLDKLK
ncbi:MurR/RpiR family transcriptional regulator [uncultured Sphaerochaeta sp.]|uniref:MurR/RpiR family transcriptional regulator n=1 Tax=uncultured Sphaerochaeta sp. TaxID=886478 RepID=UPI002A0A2FAA|nr:MurR/RpiR family transcriptional regulator [uncultured Sphaerochaeta sp.]